VLLPLMMVDSLDLKGGLNTKDRRQTLGKRLLAISLMVVSTGKNP
jgi:hypothetical protein